MPAILPETGAGEDSLDETVLGEDGLGVSAGTGTRPPHVVTVNELDPLRDEGIACYRRLQAAGVPSTGRVDLGLTHGGELILETAVGDVYDSTVADIARFARRPAPAA